MVLTLKEKEDLLESMAVQRQLIDYWTDVATEDGIYLKQITELIQRRDKLERDIQAMRDKRANANEKIIEATASLARLQKKLDMATDENMLKADKLAVKIEALQKQLKLLSP